MSDRIAVEIHCTHQGISESGSLSPNDAADDVTDVSPRDMLATCVPSISL